MKKIRMVTPETLTKLGRCFSNAEEAESFFSQMDGLANELIFSFNLRHRVPDDHASVVLLKQACMFTIFCRDHMDLIHQLVTNLDCQEITEEEANQLKDE